MSRPTHHHHQFLAIAAAVAMLSIAAPAAANTPERLTETDTSLVCDTVTGDSGMIRLAASLSSTGGPAGFLNYWKSGSDPAVDQPTLVSQGIDVSIGTGGSITATFQMFIPGDLGLEGEAEPIFVGTAELTATVEAIGEVEEILERSQNGNHRLVQRGGRQALAVTDGEVTVPTGGTFELAGAGCEGRQQVVQMTSTQPNADVSTGQLIQVDCFFETASGFVILSGQSGETETFVGVLIVDGTDVFFGEADAPDLSLHGVRASVSLPMDGDPNVVASADVSARFSTIERDKGKLVTESGWAMETAYLLGVDGVLSIDGPAGALELPMDACFATAQIGISQSH